MQPRRRLAAAVHRRLVIDRRRRVVVVEVDVVLARPDHLDRLAELFRQHGRFRAVVGLRFPAEAAAEQRHVTGDVLLVDAHRGGHRLLHRLRILRRRPDGDLAVAEFGDRRRRLHRRVRRQRRVVGGFEDLAAFGELRVDVAEIAEHLARLLRGRQQLFLERLRLEDAVRAVVPFDLELAPPLERRPRAVGDHGDAAERLEEVRRLERVQPDRLLDALHAFRGGIVDAADRAAEHRRVLDRRVDHAVAEDVEAELRLAGDDVLLVVGGGVLADEAPRGPRLELQHLALRHAQLGRRRHQRAVAEPAAARRVHHFVVLRRALGLGHSPLRRRRAHQHRPRRGAGMAERFVEVADRSRAVGVLVAVARIADALLDGDAAPVGVELVGRDLRQAGPDAGAHLGAVRHDEDRAVGPDAEIDARVEGRRLGLRAEGRGLRPRGLGE